MEIDILHEFLTSLMAAIAYALVAAFATLVGAVFTMWLNVRSLRKANGALFKKVRELEKHSYGKVTSELDVRE